MKPRAKAMPKGMDEFFSFIRLLSDDESYQEKAAKLAEQIARHEELVGAYDTLEKAQRYLSEAEDARQAALREKEESDQTSAEVLRIAKEEAVRHINKATSDRELAAKLLVANQRRTEETTNWADRVGAELAERERVATVRGAQLDHQEQDLKVREHALAEKERKLKEILA